MAISTAISSGAVGRAVGVESKFADLRAGKVQYLPQRIAVIGQGADSVTYPTDKQVVFSAADAGARYGFGSDIHMAVLGLFPSQGGGLGSIPVTVYPVQKAVGAVAAAGTITVSGTVTKAGAFVISLGGFATREAIVSIGDNATAVAAAITSAISDLYLAPVTASAALGVVTCTAKCSGETGNGVKISISGPSDIGLTFAVVQPTGGTGAPSISGALSQFGDVWETLVINCGIATNTTTLGALSAASEARWLPEVGTPFMAFSSSVVTDVATAYAVSDARKTDRVNVQFNCPGSESHPCYITGCFLAPIAVIAQDNPPRDYGSQPIAGVLPGAENVQWTSGMRDAAVKAGCSTVQIRDGVVYLSDTVTMYHPTGEEPPAYRYACDMQKVWTCRYNVQLEFRKPSWDGAPLIPDNQATVNASARKPKSAVAVVWQIIDNLALDAILSDPETAKESVLAGINSANPKRLDLSFTTAISGNTNIISVTNNFGFYFGG